MTTDLISELRKQYFNIVDTDNENRKLYPLGNDCILHIIYNGKNWEIGDIEQPEDAEEDIPVHSKNEAEKFTNAFNKIKLDLLDYMDFEKSEQDLEEEEVKEKTIEQPEKQEVKNMNKEKNTHEQNTSTTLLDIVYEYTGNDVLEIFGETGSGKSKLSMEVAKQGLAAGKKVFYLDTERNITKKDMEELKGCTYKYTPVLDEIDKTCQNLPACDIVIVDSIGFPILTTFARMNMKQKGDALLKLIAIFGDLKTWAYKNNGIVIVTNQPESDFNKAPGHVLRPFGDKSQFAAKEILRTEIVERRPDCTKIKLSAFRSRSVGHGTKIADVKITSDGVEYSF